MSSGESNGPPSLGFLTIHEHPQLGLIGGYLVLNIAGRPLEFHCTTSVKPNRAQQILFGATLNDYLYGELIGQTLVNKAAAAPWAVFTDQPEALALQDFVRYPVALVLEPCDGRELKTNDASATPAEHAARRRLDAAHRLPDGLHRCTLGANQLAFGPEQRNDAEELVRRCDKARSIDLLEPFDRIREAIEEAQRGSR